MEASERTAAVFFVGNRLMLDDGVGPAAYDEILAGYDIPENVSRMPWRATRAPRRRCTI